MKQRRRGSDAKATTLCRAGLVVAVVVLAGCSRGTSDAVPPASTVSGTTAAPGTTASPGTTGTTPSPGGTAPADTTPPTEAPGPSSVPSSSTSTGVKPPSSVTSTTRAGTPPPVDPDETVAPARLEQAYATAFDAKCREIWSISPTGVLTDPDDEGSEYVLDECLSQREEGMGELLDTEAEAAESGVTDAETAASSLTTSGRLCYQTRCWEG